jgi:hypothetical protein
LILTLGLDKKGRFAKVSARGFYGIRYYDKFSKIKNFHTIGKYPPTGQFPAGRVSDRTLPDGFPE